MTTFWLAPALSLSFSVVPALQLSLDFSTTATASPTEPFWLAPMLSSSLPSGLPALLLSSFSDFSTAATTSPIESLRLTFRSSRNWKSSFTFLSIFCVDISMASSSSSPSLILISTRSDTFWSIGNVHWKGPFGYFSLLCSSVLFPLYSPVLSPSVLLVGVTRCAMPVSSEDLVSISSLDPVSLAASRSSFPASRTSSLVRTIAWPTSFCCCCTFGTLGEISALSFLSSISFSIKGLVVPSSSRVVVSTALQHRFSTPFARPCRYKLKLLNALFFASSALLLIAFLMGEKSTVLVASAPFSLVLPSPDTSWGWGSFFSRTSSDLSL
mmetsp:Transcript_5133/g.12162  ORF Transcript_5133/g.12162 Transcript_5133/m.12162 type:complete len:326 (+) Transcript_5133:236-1213(+)